MGMFFGIQRWMMSSKVFDINYLINPREQNGEIMLGIIMKYYPHKVDHGKLQSIMMEKKEQQLIKWSQMQDTLQHHSADYKD
jgi:hypothetical protein